MAQYRLEASIIGRTAGRSVTAAAAYRAAESIYDERTGNTHDYTSKRGVLHTEIIAPENTPDWMLDRSKLWNAVEKAERRKDSQLARELTLSLPHELNDDQRRELVQGFVRDQFTPRGLIADLAIHSPGRDTDQRNHHAHILLTMRALTEEGFGQKIRLPEKERKNTLLAEREDWAAHQNRMFERLNMPQRVDHRSYLDRDIDRLPTLHLGPYAAELEKKGERTRLGNENRKIAQDNSRIAERYRLEAEAANVRKVIPYRSPMPRTPITPVFNMKADPAVLSRREEQWRQRNHDRFVKIERREMYELLDLGRKHEPQKHRLEAELDRRNGVFKATVQAEIDAIDRRAQAKGVTRFFRSLTGGARSDSEARALHIKTLESVAEREQAERRTLETNQTNERVKVMERYKGYRAKLEHVIAGEADRRKSNLERSMDEHRDRKYPEKAPPPPKLEPSLKPAPPRGAGQDITRSSEEAFSKKALDWARTPEGKKALERDPNPNKPRLDWNRAAPDVPKPEGRDIWKAEPVPEKTPRKPDRER